MHITFVLQSTISLSEAFMKDNPAKVWVYANAVRAQQRVQQSGIEREPPTAQIAL